MLPSVAMMPSLVSSTRAREKVLPSCSTTSFWMSSIGRMVSPVTFTEDTVYTSPSATLAVTKMSRLSGEMATWVDSTLKST